MVGHSRHRRVSNGFLPTRVQPPGVTPEHFAEVARRHASVEHTSEVSSRLKRSRWSSILCTALTVTCRQVPHALSSLCTISACTYFRNSRIMPYGMMKVFLSLPSRPELAKKIAKPISAMPPLTRHQVRRLARPAGRLAHCSNARARIAIGGVSEFPRLFKRLSRASPCFQWPSQRKKRCSAPPPPRDACVWTPRSRPRRLAFFKRQTAWPADT
jgi:hypothetical protein